MTATLTSIAQSYNDGARAYCFHLRTSTVAAGSLWTAAAAWIFIASAAGTVTKRHHGLELIHLATEDGEQAMGLVVDEDGTAEFSAIETASIGATFAFTAYADADSGNDSNDGLTISTPKLTLTGASGALSLFRGGNWSAGAEHRLFMQGTFSVTSPSDGTVWNYNSQANGSGSELTGRMHFVQWAGETQAQVSITTDSSFCSKSSGQALHVDGVHIVGSYTAGGSAVTENGISISVPSTGYNGPNVTLRNMQLRGFFTGLVQNTSGLATSEMGNGEFDWVVCENVTFGICYSTHVFLERNRYVGFGSCTWGELNGAGTGQGFRCGLLSYASWTDCTQDRTVGAWKANVFRLPGGQNTGTWDVMQFISVHNHVWLGSTEAVEFEQALEPEHCYYADIWFHACTWDSGVGGTYMFSIGGSLASGYSLDLSRIRMTNCAGRCSEAGARFARVLTDGSSQTPKIHSVMLDQNTWYQEQAPGFFSRGAVFFETNGHADNFDADCFTILSNYAFAADTDANSPRCFWVIVSASAKVGASDYNVLGSAGTNTTTWDDANSLATWQGASGLDGNSFLITSASHNLTTVTALSFDPKPAADGTPSATLPQVRRGMPTLGYTDADRYLRDASLPDCGSHEYGTGTLMDDADFGGGGGGGFTQQADAPLTLRLNLRM